MSGESFADDLAGGCRCVVLEARSAQRVDRLVDGLGLRGATVEVAASAAAALKALAAHDTQVFIVSDSGDDDIHSLLATVRHRHPRTKCWRYEADGAGLVSLQPVAGARPDPGELTLIDAIANKDDKMPAVATAVIEARSGLSGVRFVRDRADVPADGQAIAVADRGWLCAASPAKADALQPWADWLARWFKLADAHQQLEQLAITDELTGLFNRRHFDQRLEQFVNAARQDQTRVTLLVFDIDDFKRYNDRFGHSAGDDILRESAKLMRSAVRQHDLVARIGGDEFAVIFWDADEPRQPDSEHPSDPLAAARRFQRAICEHRFPKLAGDAPATLTISGGIATFPRDGADAGELFEAADAMAIESKRAGKNVLTLGPGAAALTHPQLA